MYVILKPKLTIVIINDIYFWPLLDFLTKEITDLNHSFNKTLLFHN